MGWVDSTVRLMDSLSGLASALAWPLAAALIGLMFKPQITAFLERVTGIRVGDREIELRNTLEDTVTESRSIPLRGPGTSIESQLSTEWRQLEPIGMIVEAWLLIEKKVFELGQAVDLPMPALPRSPTAFRVSRDLWSAGHLDEAVYSTLRSLRRVRNDAVHNQGFVIREDDAQEYMIAATRLISFIDGKLTELKG